MGRNKLAALLFPLIVIAGLYSDVIHGDFQFDDDAYIAENNWIKAPLNPFEGDTISRFSSSTRPLTELSFSLNYALGGMQVEGYHILNIMIHLLMTALVYFFLRRLLLLPDFNDAFGGRAGCLALLTAAIFAVHPLQTESVSYIVQRAEAVASLFYLLCLYCLIRFNETRNGRSYVFLMLGVFLFVLGYISKEILITMPLVFLLYATFFTDRERLRRAVLWMAPLIITGAFIGIKEVKGFVGSGHVGFDIPGIGQPEYFYTQMRVLLTYVRLIFFPLNQNVDYDYPIYRTLFAPEIAGSILFWISGVFMSFYILRNKGKWKRHFRLMGFGILWFLALLLPTSSVVPLRDVIFEHRIYLAMLGIIITAVIGADLLFVSLRERHGNSLKNSLIIALVMCQLFLLSVAAYKRNEVWQTKLALWQDVVKKSPEKSRSHNNLGNCYYLKGDDKSALRHYLKALKLDPDNVETYYNTALVLDRLGRRMESVFYYAKFVEKAPRTYIEMIKTIEKKLFQRG